MNNRILIHVIRMTKLFSYAFLLQCMTMSLLFAWNGNAQVKSIEEVMIRIPLNGVSIEGAFLEIEKASNFNFVYLSKEIKNLPKITVDNKNQSLYDMLMVIAIQTNLEFKQINQNIHVQKSNSKNSLESVLILELDITVTGRVTYENGEPIPGVTVSVPGTTIGTATDLNGQYTLSVPERSNLVFSFIGFQTQRAEVGDQSIINAILKEDLTSLDEVVVVGYGTQMKSDLTGSVSSIKTEDLNLYPATDAIQALQGLVAGVQVQSVNGEPGSGYKISIRGNTSINANSDPLIVVDGFPGGAMPPPGDIESIDILKDASSTAIYGSRGANGVILITTKNGKSGEFKIDFTSSLSLQKEINRFEVLNATEYATYVNEIDPGYYNTPSSYGLGTNWQDIIYRDGYLQNYQLAVSGGTDKINYYLSGNLFDQEGIIIDSGFKRYSFTSNIKAQVLDWVNIGANIFAQRSDLDGVNSQTEGYYAPGVPDQAYKFAPTQGIYNEDGTFTLKERGLPADNPYANVMAVDQLSVSDFEQGNIYAELDLIEGLKYKSTIGVISSSGRWGEYYKRTSYRGSSTDGEANLSYNKGLELASENYLTYSSNFGGIHDLNVMAGYSYQNSVQEGMVIARATGFSTDAFSFWNLGAGTGTPTYDSYTTKSELSSIYGRLNYSFKSKYLFTFNARYDGSSRFAKNNKWAFFPSGAFAWDLKDEGFLSDVEQISQLKLRISHGLTGNQAIRPYQSLASLTDVFATDRGRILPAIKPGTISNPNLTWETTAQTNIGLDLEIWSGIINVTADYYKMITSDLLFNVPVPRFSGFSTQLQNIGEVQNSGFEFAVGAKILSGKLNWDSNTNISFNRNKILKLVENDSEGNAIFYSSAPVEGAGGIQTQILKEGEPVGTFFGYVFDGVQQEGESLLDNAEGIGGEKFKDLSPDGVLDDNDRIILGSPHPDFIWGWNNSFQYGNFDLNIFVQGSQGGKMINYTRMELGIMNGRSNASKEILNRWTPTNTDTDIPQANINRFHVFSDRWLEDGSYIRLKNISFGYALDENILRKFKLRSARIYLSAQNILTMTNYKGVDPEVAYGNSNTNLGLDYASYPNTRSMTIGVNFGF